MLKTMLGMLTGLCKMRLRHFSGPDEKREKTVKKTQNKSAPKLKWVVHLSQMVPLVVNHGHVLGLLDRQGGEPSKRFGACAKAEDLHPDCSQYFLAEPREQNCLAAHIGDILPLHALEKLQLKCSGCQQSWKWTGPPKMMFPWFMTIGPFREAMRKTVSV